MLHIHVQIKTQSLLNKTFLTLNGFQIDYQLREK